MNVPAACEISPRHAIPGVIHEHVDVQTPCLEVGTDASGSARVLEVFDHHVHARAVFFGETRLHGPKPRLTPCGNHEIEPLRGEHLGKGFSDAG